MWQNSERLEAYKELNSPLLGQWPRGKQEKECRQTLRAKVAPPTLAQPHRHKELNPENTLNEFGGGYNPQSLQQGMQSC